ncbi:hypothetical protein D3C84_823210 [compost metagenome]
MRQVDARTEAVVLAEALADIQMLTDAPVVTDVGAEATQRHVPGAFGLQVDAATDAGAGRGHAVDEGIRTFEDFHTLQRVSGNDLPRQDAVETVVGNIVAVEGQATDHERLGLVGKAGSLTHR